MAVGEYVPNKFIWLLDNVELVGTVYAIASTEDGGHGDDFAVLPDPNYRHLIHYFRGNNPLPWASETEPGVMHLETYPLDFSAINRYERWVPPQKPDGQRFQVQADDGTSRDLQVGDHVRVTGRWVIDHHPEYCSLPAIRIPPESSRCRSRGWLRVGQTHTELHPFDWQDIRLVGSPSPGDATRCLLSLAAPLYEQQYVGNWKWAANEFAGVSGKVFIDDSEPNFHSTVSASITLDAPPLPNLPATSLRRLRWTETVFKLGTGMNLGQIRSVTPRESSIDVQVTIAATGTTDGRPSILGPARDRWVAQLEYAVFWMLAGNEISCITRSSGGGFPPQPGPLIGVGGLFPNGERWWLRLADAVRALQEGHRFFMRVGLGTPVNIVVKGSGTRTTLGTDSPSGRPDPFLDLPACPDPPIIG
ncbi:hypothetical protein SAMN05444920_14812 [Nonomuraea solani]|uniref:Uncharacterized protein n=1 Tax=Nonomuraea solani TaxID=1144553 RepID=A0A1H6F1A1_9ACTN|nr:hypothetical protein [Nonomuraea solani]SEH03920.1 hypothetical protein SAMN05444920_14812 [Nonomuraea solani]